MERKREKRIKARNNAKYKTRRKKAAKPLCPISLWRLYFNNFSL
jgi:hypothetical protein